MADKTSFTKDEWTLLLESPMMAGMAITAAEPSGLWGLLKESFAGGTALTRAVTGSDTNALVMSVVTDFSSGEGRSAARYGLKTKFANSKPRRHPQTQQNSKADSGRSVKAPPRQPRKAGAFSVAASR
jgi:hypothetical protein